MKEALPFYTYEEILERMLDRVPNDLDKREGSIVYDMLSIEAIELAQHYAELTNIIDLLYPDTATGEWLDRIAKQYGGLERYSATQALRYASFVDNERKPLDIEIGKRFAINDITLNVIEATAIKGKYILKVEQTGVIGNRYSGQMLPLEGVDSLGLATLEDVIIQARDRETDEEFRKRLMDSIVRPNFGGNISDYEQHAMRIEGVGEVKVFPIWKGPGTVKVTIGNIEGKQASPELVEKVQNLFMPPDDNHLGLGLAPVGHNVTVGTSEDYPISVQAKVTLDQNVTLPEVKDAINNSINTYIKSIPFNEYVVYLTRVISSILIVPGVKDVEDVTLSYVNGNIKLYKTAEKFETPIMGEVTLTLKEG